MADAWLESLLTHIANIYHLDVTEDVDGQQVESYPDTWHPDIANWPCAVHTDGEILQASAVGSMIGSTAIAYGQEADIREHDRFHFGPKVYYVNGTPARYYDHLGGTPMTAHLLEVGLREDKTAPA